jgi:hypothetical protein
MTSATFSCQLVTYLAVFAFSLRTLGGLGVHVSLLKWIWPCVKGCLVRVCEISLICDCLHGVEANRHRRSVPPPNPYLRFYATTHATLPPDHTWPKRVRRTYQLMPESLLPAPPTSRSLCCHRRSQASVAWDRGLAPYPPS